LGTSTSGLQSNESERENIIRWVKLGEHIGRAKHDVDVAHERLANLIRDFPALRLVDG